ncbi:MAG: carboxypeptidase-like regulatory domain-containing protein, partial [Lentimicrobiaceae bacterium]|nr:carboxypeptidase-like regulatory domain-containing protein [Lentimicrobiaceae bacterium]
GTSNVLVNICFDNTGWSGNSYVYGGPAAGMTWHEHADNAVGCSFNAGTVQSNRPNVRFEIGPPPPPPSVSVQVGTGTATFGFPFYTLYMDARTQLLYPADEIYAAGGMPGDILSIGFNVSSANAHVMNGFNIDMQNYSGATIPTFVETGWTNVYSGTYAVPGTGLQTIDLQTPFTWDGVSNLLVSVCFDNNNYASNSLVYGTNLPGLIAANRADLSTGSGCTEITTVGSSYTTRANIYLEIVPASTLPTGIVQGFVTNGFGVPIANATVAADGDNGSYVTTSGPNGAYVINDISIGTYTMAAVKDGYNMVTVEGVVIMPSATTYQNFELPRPSMAVTPNPYNVTVNPNEMLEGAMNVANNGDGTLEWTAEVIYMDESNHIAPGIDPTIPVRDFTNSTPVESFGEDASIGRGNGEPLNSRNTMLCPAGSLFNNAPVGSDNGYNAAGAYTCYQQFTGVSGSFNKLIFWAIFTAAPPASMDFQIEIRGPGATQPGPVVSSITASLAPVNTGTPVIGYNTYMFTADLPSTNMATGWIGIHCTTASPTFYWLNSMTGTGNGSQFNGSSYVALDEYLAMCLTGGGSGAGDGWLTLGSYEGTVGPYGNYSIPAYFNAEGAEAGEVYTAEVTFTSEPNVGTVTVPVTMVVAGPALAMPENLTAVLTNPVTGQVNLSWTFNPTDAFLNFAIRRNGVVVGYTANNNYVDMLPTFGTYDYTVQAVYDEGMSSPAGPVQVEWANPTAVVSPLYIYDELWVNSQAVQTVTISNTGEGTLAFNFPEWVEDDGNRAPLAYCTASGGCDEYIGTFIFGDQINNSSGCTNYGNYTSISADVEIGETYAVTLQNPSP